MLTIPEPCNEDFGKMTPTQRGAFCSKCQIDTFDFRDLSNREINHILLKNKNSHLCGQFKHSQLQELNQGFLEWKNQHSTTFRSKFLLALILVFGLTLFSCNTEEEKELIQKYAIELTTAPTEKPIYVNEISEVTELNLTDHTVPLSGKISPMKPSSCTIETVIEEEGNNIDLRGQSYALGGVPVTMEMAGDIIQVDYLTYLEATIDSVEESILPESLMIDPDFFEINSYPNPTNDNATLSIEVKFEGQFDIKLYDMNGRLIRDMYVGELVAGRQMFPINLDAEQSGIYIVNVISRDQNETLKVQKLN